MLPDKVQIQLSKFMSKILRHSPEEFGLSIDPIDGSCAIADLIEVLRVQTKWSEIRVSNIEEVVARCEKQRFEINGDRIRARYGHSHDKVSYPMAVTPNVLYHGTNVQVAPVILKQGLRPMKRQYVHLSEGLHFAILAGQRRGKLVILAIDTEKASQAGVVFYYAGNEVWLADIVPAEFCSVYGDEKEGQVDG
ncbi:MULTISPECIES: RNA 2'-phosphotransferase [unclassified Paenibacillus]|uniref:RNA 2'-phosphotransferase n=1 Tax=unclassified Paenibacillus TaxID=185978 RepID=UPI0007098B79|nr:MULTISPECIES: RNA 2'-phosphotransferase [unclassified Paenibacillus]KQX45798.1 RNA 2'-phosphotransferase [Paenibacillus sp. Root444D2]KRE50752.1 RNA 2'-phosphotransferase [Paenibacillus sp. Soil724D2]